MKNSNNTTTAKNDFRSLLSDFQVATNSSLKGSNRSARITSPSSEAATVSAAGFDRMSSSKSPYKNNVSQSTDKERIMKLWRISQIRKGSLISAESPRVQPIDGKSDGDHSNLARFHLAICICIIDVLPQEHIWREFTQSEKNIKTESSALSNVNDDESCSNLLSSSAEVYIHAKYPERINSPWVRSKTIDVTYRPDWNDVRIIRAMLALASKALNDDRTTHLMFATESCIPLATLDEIAETVMLVRDDSVDGNVEKQSIHLNRSFIHAYSRDSSHCTRFDERSCFDTLSTYVPQEAIYKALPGWCLFSRMHMQAIINIPKSLQDVNETIPIEPWTLFTNVWAPEEVYFPTCLALAGHLPSPDVIPRSLMFARWNEKAKNHSDRAHPLVYDDYFDQRLVQEVRDLGCLFMRKITRPLDLTIWKNLVVCTKSPIKLTTRKRNYDDMSLSNTTVIETAASEFVGGVAINHE